MTIRVPMADLAPGERDLDAEQARYVGRVHRLRAGDRFVAFDPARAIECDAEVLGEGRVRLGEARAAPAAPRAITWIHGAPKGDKADAIVRDATELGATRIVFVQTARSVAKPPAARAARWAKIAREAARQCGRGDAPVVELAADWASALETADGETRVCLDPRGAPLRDVLARARLARVRRRARGRPHRGRARRRDCARLRHVPPRRVRDAHRDGRRRRARRRRALCVIRAA